jgi:hypothetical protein
MMRSVSVRNTISLKKSSLSQTEHLKICSKYTVAKEVFNGRKVLITMLKYPGIHAEISDQYSNMKSSLYCAVMIKVCDTVSNTLY